MNLFGDDLPDIVRIYSFNLSRLKSAGELHLLDTLRVLYQVVTNEVSIQIRESLLKGVVHEIRSAQLDAACLLPVVMSESDPEIVDLAVVSYLELCRVSESDQFTAMEHLSSLLQNDQTLNRGAVHASIACFGDRRLCGALRPLQKELTSVELSGFYDAIRQPRKIKLATLDYMLSWIVSQEHSGDRQLIDTLAAGLSAYLLSSVDSSQVFDSTYNFGPNCFPNYTPETSRSYEQVMLEVAPLINQLKSSELAPLKGLATILENPSIMSLEALETAQGIKSRSDEDRRASDRRIVTLMPLLERRQAQRRHLRQRREA